MTEKKPKNNKTPLIQSVLKFLKEEKELLITIIFGTWGILLTQRSNHLNITMLDLAKHQDSLSAMQYMLSQKQDSTSLDLYNFGRLLAKIDTTINLSTTQSNILNSQLTISNAQQKERQREQAIVNANNDFLILNDLSRLQSYSLRIYSAILPLRDAKKTNDYSFFHDTRSRATFINKIDELMSSELGNKELFKSMKIISAWRIANAHILVEKSLSEKYNLKGIEHDNTPKSIEHFIATMDKVEIFANLVADYSLNSLMESARKNGIRLDTTGF